MKPLVQTWDVIHGTLKLSTSVYSLSDDLVTTYWISYRIPISFCYCEKYEILFSLGNKNSFF